MLKTIERRKMVLTFVVAGLGAVFAEHLLKPNVKKRLRV